MINFALPGVYSLTKLNLNLVNAIKKFPDYFYPGIKIDAVYGIFPFCIWDGGRIFASESHHCTSEEIISITKQFNDKGVPVRLILTNSQLKPSDFYDHYGNVMLECCHEDMNQVVCNNDEFRDYISQNFPKYQFISSTTKCLNKEDFLVELKKDEYAEVCLDYNLNKNMKLLETIPLELRSKCEFLVNAICPPGCVFRKEHYRLNSIHQLTYGKIYSMPECGINMGINHPETVAYKNNLSYNEIVEKYVPKGFIHFKLEGRTLPPCDMAVCYARYMAKPEFKDEVISLLLSPEGVE